MSAQGTYRFTLSNAKRFYSSMGSPLAGKGLSDVGSGYTIFWSGRKSERKAGVGFAVRTSLVSQLESQPKGINDRIMTMRLPLQDNRNATLISVYEPTMTNPDDIKEVFYQQLDVIVRSVPTADRLIILGDLNARIGSNHTAWTGIKIGRAHV